MPPLVVETVLSLKEFVGREIAVTDWLTMTQDRIDRFAEPRRTGSGFTSIASARKGSRPIAQRLPTVS